MPYESLVNDGRIEPHAFVKEDFANYLGMAARNLADASLPGLSDDNRFALAYQALKAATQAVMAAEGYRATSMPGHHTALFEFLAQTEQGRWRQEAGLFRRALRKRNIIEYDSFGVVTQTQADQLVAAAGSFLAEVEGWLQARGLLS